MGSDSSDWGNDLEVLDAKAVYLVLKKDVAVSRASRLLWFLNHIGRVVTVPKPTDDWKWNESHEDIELVSVLPVNTKPVFWRPEINYQFKYKITSRTKTYFLGLQYKMAICLDMSPSQAIVDIQRGELLIDQMICSLNRSLHQITNRFTIPGSCIEIEPVIYVTVIAHTPFFTRPAQQVLVEGMRLTESNVAALIAIIEKQLRALEATISQVTSVAHEQIEAQQVDDERLVGTLFEEENGSSVKPPNIPMVSPDASFINMLRYSMLALTLLPDFSLGHIIVITDGVVCIPDINILESLLQQLHFDSTIVSFLIVGSSYHPHCSYGYVAYRDILQFISRATLGVYADNYSESNDSISPNFLQQSLLLLWPLNSRSHTREYGSFQYSPFEWATTNRLFQGSKVPNLLVKKQSEDKMNTSLVILLNRRLREGYTLDGAYYENNRLEICLSLPWKTHTYLLYTIITQWPLNQSLVIFQISIKAPYESLHDTTCPLKRQSKSAYRQAVVERFWATLSQLTSSDTIMAQHLNSFSGSSGWYVLPESVRNGMSLFVLLPNISVTDTLKPIYTPNDTAYSKFGSFWQPICNLDSVHWRKWFHMHRISIVLHHDQPLPINLHMANASGRYTMVQCRQAVAALYGMLSEWASFVLVDNHTYIQFISQTGEKNPLWFCVIRVTSKLPCAVLTLGFISGTPGQIRNEVCDNLKAELRQLKYAVRANPALQDLEKSPIKPKENACCTILNKPLEKILIRYERMPLDLTTVVFPDGTQPTFDPYTYFLSGSSTRRQSQSTASRTPSATSSVSTPAPTTAALLTTLSRYLHHRRWVWAVSHPINPQLSIAAIARILNTLTKLRLKEGFSFAHCSSGIINMVLEVEMAQPIKDSVNIELENGVLTGKCIIQYVLFPPHNAVCKRTEQIFDFNGNDSDGETTECEIESSSELQIVTEVWVEPQYGVIWNCTPERKYLSGQSYHKIADVIGEIDSQCISSLLTLEHLSLMCQQKQQFSYKSMESRKISETSAPSNYKEHNFYRTISQSNYDGMCLLSNAADSEPIQSSEMVLPLDVEERIRRMPLAFNLLNILPKCRQALLLFSTFSEDRTVETDLQTPNLLLLDSIFLHLQRIHDQEMLLRYNESQAFLNLVLNQGKSSTNHFAKQWCSNEYMNNSQDLYYPLWRCFVKGISLTHVVLTFIPASLKDLQLLNVPKPSSANHSNIPAAYTTSFNYHRLSSNGDSNGNSQEDSHAYILPIIVYDCPLAVLMDGFINNDKTNKDSQEYETNGTYEDYTYQNGFSFKENRFKLDDSILDDMSDKDEDVEETENKACMKRHCRTLISMHSTCFVVCVFQSLHLKYQIHSSDVQAAVALCHDSVIRIDISKYIKTVCGHTISKSNDFLLTKNSFSTHPNSCQDLIYLHRMIKDKFKRTIKETFHAVPSNAEYYFCSPVTDVDKSIDGSDSDNWEGESTSSGDSGELSRDISSNSHSSTRFQFKNMDGYLFDEITPLFLHFECTVKNFGSVPIQLLPTCLEEICSALDTNPISLEELHVTLDIICSTLPREIQTVIDCSESTIQNDAVFSGEKPRGSVGSDGNPPLEILETSENMEILSHLLPYQYRAITTLKEKIKWQLHDEISTALLDVEPVSISTLQMVVQHVVTSNRKPSCLLDNVTLNFVYGPSESMGRFIQEFRKLPVPDYKMLKEGDFYYLSKDYPTVTALDKNRIGSKTSKEAQQSEIESENQSISDVTSIIIDLLNSVDQIVSEDSRQTANKEISPTFENFDINTNLDQWLVELDKRRNILPNFWMIMRVNGDAVTVYFHCRFLELQKRQVSGYLAVHRSVISAIKSLCKHVNQFLLLQSLHDTRTCDRLLESEEVSRDLWNSQTPTPIITRNTSFSRLKSVEDSSPLMISEISEMRGQEAYLEASLKFMPGFFACSVVWETHFILHPRLKTSSNVRPASRGIQALRSVLNKFSVVNRNNMFVYRDNSLNVFYLRLHENMNSSESCSGLNTISSEENIHGLVSRSPSITSLPLGVQKQYIGSLSGNVADVRPRVRSFGEKESQEAAANLGNNNQLPNDTITLKVHGVTGAGRDVTTDLMQVLQNRLDDAVLELLSVMLERNPMCKLTPDDVHFIQKPFRSPDSVLKLSILNHTVPYIDALHHYLSQNLLQFLCIPKYTDSASHHHFRDYSETTEQNNKRDNEKNIFLYNQSAACGNRGIACICLIFVHSPVNQSRLSSELLNRNGYNFEKFDFSDSEFDRLVETHKLDTFETTFSPFIEFRIWHKGRINSEVLESRLKGAVNHANWDLILEKYLLVPPLCVPLSEHISEQINDTTIPTRALSNLVRTKKYNNLSQQAHSLDGVKKNPPLYKALSDTEIETKIQGSLDVKRASTGSEYNFEMGDSGMLHSNYSSAMSSWLQYGVKIRTPAVYKNNIRLKLAHPLETVVLELQRFIKVHMNDVSTKAFSQIQISDSVIYIPYDPHQFTSHCLLVGRNFNQWKSSYDPNSFSLESIESKTNEVFQKFPPLCIDLEAGKVITRQRFLLITLSSSEIIIFTYNWSKDRLEKLISHGENLGLWLSARISVFNSVIAQKLGLFHNQPVIRKNITTNNPYMPNVTEPEFVARFPSIGSANQAAAIRQTITNNTSTTPSGMLVTSLETFRDTQMSIIGHRVIYSIDPIVRSVQEMHQLRQYDRKYVDEQKRLYSMWQSRGATTQILAEAHKIQLLRQQSRIIHYCQTPFLFLPTWRLQSAATRDHSLLPTNGPLLLDQMIPAHCKNWHNALCNRFFDQYKQYLQTLGFMPIQVGNGNSSTFTKTSSKKISEFTSSKPDDTINYLEAGNSCYLQKSMLGGILVFELFFSEPFFVGKLYALECQRIQNKTSRQSMNQFVLSFLDECDRIKVQMHLHSFAYDFHLRSVHSYICEDNSEDARLCSGYHITNFLDDFIKYYSKAPNYARNLIYAERISIGDLLTPSKQLYDYLLSHEKHYNMNVFLMQSDHELLQLSEKDSSLNEYVLVQITSSPSYAYKDSQDCRHTDDFDITLIITYIDSGHSNEPNNKSTLFLKYYIMLTSRRDIYPKSNIERTLGKFRTVSSRNCFSNCVTRIRSKVANVDLEINTSLGQEVEEDILINLNEAEDNNSDSERVENVQSDSSTELCDMCKSVAKRQQTSSIEIRQESVNYLGYYSSHEQLMQQLILREAEIARQQITDMVTLGMVHCRTHSLWNKLVSKNDTNQLSYKEFMELRELTQLERISDIEPRLTSLLAGQNFSWFQQLAKILLIKYVDQHRSFLSPDGSNQHIVLLHPRYSGAFMMLSMNFQIEQAELFAAYRESAQLEPSDITIEDRKSLINDFINCLCFHVWMGML